MFGTQNLALFVLSGILLNLTPGQDTIYIVGRSVAQGRRAGFLSVFGIVSGSVVHTFAAAFGLSAILATSARAFSIVKFAGAAYLVYLGIGLLVDRRVSVDQPAVLSRESSWAVYRAGFFTNLFNPKVALFFMAFLPQFVTQGADSKILAFLFLGGIFMFTGTLWCLVLASCAATVSYRLREHPRTGTVLRRVTGVVFLGLGLKLALSRES
jgi:threonine/homoserine/homoserine lactone efflux protein